MKIKIYYDKINFRLRETASIKKFLEKVIREEKKIPGDLNFIFTDDSRLKKINKNFLGHDYNTDVVSFGENKGEVINGEIYISINTVRNNSRLYNLKVREEIIRVMIHGVLHLCGYEDDETKNMRRMFNKQEMRVKEYKGLN